MEGLNTTLSAGGPQFRSTAWSVIRDAQGADAGARDRALDRLVSVYWRPVYWALRLDWNAGAEEARDLTQEYFSAFLEKGLVDDVDPSRGRFRSWVKATLKNFMLTWRRDQAALKRGGGRAIVALQDLTAVENGSAVAAAESPERRFDRELMRAIVQESLRALDEAYRREGTPAHFELFKAYYIEESAGRAVPYDALAARFGVGFHDVKNRLSEARARFRETILGFLRDGVTSEEELLGEIQEVFGS